MDFNQLVHEYKYKADEKKKEPFGGKLKGGIGVRIGELTLLKLKGSFQALISCSA